MASNRAGNRPSNTSSNTRFPQVKAVVASLMGGAAMALGPAAMVWACTNLATLNLSASTVRAGDTVAVTGSSFSVTADAFARRADPVEIHWDGVQGSVLAAAQTDRAGFVATTLTVPTDATPGEHMLVATQLVETDDGMVPAYGTPARAAIVVTGPGAARPTPTLPEGAVAPMASDARSDVLALAVVTSVLGLTGAGLFAAGVAAVVRAPRRRVATAAGVRS